MKGNMAFRLRLASCIGVVLLSAGTGVAQTSPANQTQPQGTAAVPPVRIGGMLGDLPAIKGLPYTLTQSTRLVKTFGDGTTTTGVAEARSMRDSEGRTRIEVGPIDDGPFKPDRIFITDPVARFHANFDVRGRTGKVTYLPGPKVRTPEEEDARAERNAEALKAGEARDAASPNFQRLGKKTIAGLDTEGTRRTLVIPAGVLGNASEVRVITESWWSADLKIALETTTDDPRSGKGTAIATDLHRTEPDAALFKVPDGYKVTETGKP